jgi:hypothetical protein
MRQLRIIFYLFFITLVSCTKKDHHLFEKMDGSTTGINFINTLSEDQEHNLLAYEYFYNGCGVAVGDINNDGLPDIYITGNEVPDKLYLNKGNWKFEDITESAGVAGQRGWKTGVPLAEVNGEGLREL